ncbi:MAG TPA: phosphatase PAP2 family protein [Candidatus Saccharimonadales bacterium]|nr:phosphatase PAP2 family protein [Candidatus Saccharimonadales bacterium]
MLYILFFWRAIWTPDLLFMIFLMLFVLYGQGRQFIFSFGPFVLLLLTYEGLRSFVPYINKHVHYSQMIDFDRWLFHGTLPTIWLQHLLWHGHLVWYDYYFYILYMCHFLTPLVIGIAIWKLRPAYFNRYVIAFLLLSYAGFITYIVFPAAPPWMAAQMGYIPHIERIANDVWYSIGVHNFPSIYQKFSPNEVAAVPSLHAAYPTLMWLFIRRAFGWRWAAAFTWYPISMWIGIIYMGEHYAFDALLGVGYAVIAYGLTNLLLDRYGIRMRAAWGRWQQRNAAPGLAATQSSD